MSVEVVPQNEATTSATQTWYPSTPSVNEKGEDEEDENQNHMSPSLCKQGILKHFENLVNKLAMGWKYHVANTEGIKDSWLKFEDFYSNVCQFTGGQFDIYKIKILKTLKY